jgi:hypothetical protein
MTYFIFSFFHDSDAACGQYYRVHSKSYQHSDARRGIRTIIITIILILIYPIPDLARPENLEAIP